MKKLKKKYYLLVAILCISAPMFSQHVVKGFVVDQYGNPVEGAKVASEKVFETETGMDGSFTLESPTKKITKLTVSKLGMNSAIVKVRNANRVKLTNKTWYSTTYNETGHWFAGLDFAIPEYNEKPIGLMAGWQKLVGFYLRGVYSPGKSYHGGWICAPNNVGEYYYDDMLITGKYQQQFWSVGGGLVCSLFSNLSLYAGCSYYSKKCFVESAENGYWYVLTDSHSKNEYFKYVSKNIMPEVGLMFHFNKYFINGGAGYGIEDDVLHYHAGLGFYL